MASSGPLDDPRLLAMLDMAGRLGPNFLELRYSEPEGDGSPIVWLAIGEWAAGHEVAAGLTPVAALFRLLESVIDGGTCKHCQRPTAISEDWARTMPLNREICWYQYDPEVKKFRRGCEGDV